ncbi:YrhC family protein [Alkalihalobacillus deserti]|uniref:YrhC family protein n=1 Tax=Alkalihalobacillus deserti TaxID=2879466 RepID=UPI001D143033|nr:YrhC family protein [Alkalihalobacillus deserti]
MEEKKIKQLEAKVADYKQYGFILLSLSIFLFIGLVIPSESSTLKMPELFIGGIFVTLTVAVVCHLLAMRAQNELYQEKE